MIEAQVGCKTNPCKFGGSCMVAVDGTEACQCKEGFTGVFCETGKKLISLFFLCCVSFY